MNIHEKLQKIMNDRNWTEYRLSKKSGLSETTIYNIFTRNTTPSLVTLDYICKGFGITLAQFFAEGEMVELTPELKELFDSWVNLTIEQKQAVKNLLDVMNHK